MTGGGTTSVLIIDGDNVRRGMLACTLPASRYALEFANTAEKGLDLLLKMQPGVVIVGWSTPGDLCQRIRSLHSCAVVVMDERFRDEAVGRTETEAAGADAFIPFPFDVELLEEKLRDRTIPPASVQPESHNTPAHPQPATAREPDAQAAGGGEDAWESFRDRVGATHSRLDIISYYQLLQVPESADTNVIKQAYFDRSIEFHPDRFIRLREEDLRLQIYEVFKRMSEAFKVLINPEARSRYDANLAGPDPEVRYLERDRSPSAPTDPTADARTPAGKKFLNYALLAEAEGKLRSARMYVSMALQYEPDNDSLHARLESVTRRLGL